MTTDSLDSNLIQRLPVGQQRNRHNVIIVIVSPYVQPSPYPFHPQIYSLNDDKLLADPCEGSGLTRIILPITAQISRQPL